MRLATRKTDNLEIDEPGQSLVVKVNPRFYPLEVIYSAAYALLDRAYVTLDGDPQQEILVKMRPVQPSGADLERLGREFNNELLNYTMYAVQSERNKAVRDAIIQRALLTSTQPGTDGGPATGHTNETAPQSSVSPAELSESGEAAPAIAPSKPRRGIRAAGKKATGPEEVVA